MESEFKFQESPLKKRKASGTSQFESTNLKVRKLQQPDARKQEKEVQKVQDHDSPDEGEQLNHELNLKDLVHNNQDFFNKIQSSEYKMDDAFRKLMREKMFGNRIVPEKTSIEDPRILLILKEYKSPNFFSGKRVLDIGCHTGSIPLYFAAKLSPSIIIGLDIDRNLTNSAINNMHKLINQDNTVELLQKHISQEDEAIATNEREKRLNDLLSKVKSMPKSCQLAIQGEVKILKETKNNLKTISKVKETIYGKLNYRTENYIEKVDDKHIAKEQFDVVLCMRTIKWVHLCYGDVGVKALFLKVYAQLAKGGLFIFEQQPWKSYKKTKHHHKEFQDAIPCKKIELKPHLFKQYLKNIGFKLTKTIIDPSGGVDKPIYIYQK